MKPIDADKNALDATKALLDFSKVPATRLGLREALGQHPDFPSLNALSDVLSDLQVPNISARLTPDRLPEIPLPALTYLNIDGGMFAPVRTINGQVEWLHTQRGWQKESLRQFAQKWNGVTLLIEPHEQSGERNYAQNRRRETLGVLRAMFIVAAIMSISGLLLSSALQTFPWAEYTAYYLMGLTKLVGTVVSGMLVWYSLDTRNGFLQKVCQINSRSNCQNIISSSAAKLTDWLSWAEIGLFYFVGGILTLAVGLWMGSGKLLNLLGETLYLLTILTLPYTLWSIYYQWRVAREWCVLCLTVQALLWVEFYVAFGTLGLLVEGGSWLTNRSVWSIEIVCFLIAPTLWAYLKPKFEKAIQYEPLLIEFQRLKFDPKYLEALLSRHKSIPPIFEGMKVINMGNTSSNNKLILVLNPTCESCKLKYNKTRTYLEHNCNFHVQVIMSTLVKENRITNQVAIKILSLPSFEMEHALNSWFEMKEYQFDKWIQNNDQYYNNTEGVDQLSMHNRWVKLAGVTQVPASFLNRVKLPNFFHPHEISRLCTQFHNPGTY